VVPDRVVTGRGDILELSQTAGILFYVNEKKAPIEMVSVGADGRLWIMTGPLGSEERMSQEVPTIDGGKTWKQGHHQMFRRAVPPVI